MVPNKTEEQLFTEQFKYYDSDGFGECNLKNFLKSNERIGVILSKTDDLEKVFKYFDKNNKGLINYKQLANGIFKQKNIKDLYQNSENNFITILDKALLERGQCKILFNLIKSFQIFDINYTKRINIDDFLKVINGLNLRISLNDIQYLYSSNYLFNNEMINYQNIIQNLLEIYWNSNRDILSYKLFNILTNNEQKIFYFDQLKNIYKNTNLDQYLNWEIESVLEQYKNIIKIYEGTQIIPKVIKQFILYFGYGISDDNYLEELLFNLNKIYNKDLFNKKEEKKEIPKKKKIIYSENSVEDALLKLRKYLWRYGRKTLFNFIINFRFYDKEITKFITRYDFIKLLKSFSFFLDELSIDLLFERYGNETKDVINYEKLLKSLSAFSTNQKREFAILDCYESIKKRAKDNLKSIDIPYLKYLYNANNNFFNPDESLNRIDFYDSLELYHGSYHFYGIEKFLPEEFFEFYRFISIIIEDDETFINMLNQEWSPRLFNKSNVSDNIKECNFVEKKNEIPKMKNNIEENKISFNKSKDYNNDNINNQLIKDNDDYTKNLNNNDSIEKLRNILKKRGVRGLLYLQKELTLKSKDINKITYEKLLEALNSQRILLNDNDKKKIFNQFSNQGYLDFNKFIREFKKELSTNKLEIVGKVYEQLDSDNNEKIPLITIKLLYNSDNHPDVINGKINSEEKMLEFIDCFELNLILLNHQYNKDNSNFIDFELFANFYEYVAFIYENDKEFEKILESTWN